MTTGADAARPFELTTRTRWALLGVAAVALLLALVPPLGTLAARYVFVEAIQFGLLAALVPALVVLGAPWGLSTTAGRSGAMSDVASSTVHRRTAERLAASRLRHPSVARVFGFVLVYAAVVVAWRLPSSVDALARVPGLSVLEAASLLVAGVLLWLELAVSPPFSPRLVYPLRMASAAVAMWVTWIMGYLLGMSHAAWFAAYHHGRGLGLSADQELAAGVLFVTGLVYLPVIFGSLFVWLKDSEDPDDELRRLVRDERRRAGWLRPGDERGNNPGAGR